MTVFADVTQAFRVLRKRPGFSLAVFLTLALGIGANAAVFGLVRAVLLSPLPYADSEELFSVSEVDETGRTRLPSYPTFLDWQEQADVFAELAFARGVPLSYQTDDASGLLLGAFVTDDFFELLGVAAELGRVLSAADFESGAEGAVVLSHHAWRRWFGSDSGIIGRTILVEQIPRSVIGVMPPSFAYPDWGANNDLWIAMNQMPAGELTALNQRGFNADSRVVVRIRSEVDIAVVQGQMDALASVLAETYPDTNAGWERVRIQSLKDLEVRGVRSRLYMLWGSVILVLLICCLNLANLYLVHGTSRRHEYAIRTALGAGRARVFRQIITEALLLAILGGGAGLVIAWRSIAWAKGGVLLDLPRVAELTVNAPVIGFAFALSAGTALLFALCAARDIGGTALRPGLVADGARSTWATGLLSGVQAAQVGFTYVLLVGAWLLGASLVKLSQVDPGYDPTNLVVVPIQPPSPTYDSEDAAITLYATLVDRLAEVPGVLAVGLTNHGPGGRAGALTDAAVDGVPDGTEEVSVLYRTVSDGYFQAVGIPVVAGREFNPADLIDGDGPVLVNETLARLWGDQLAVGRTIGVRKASSARADFGEVLEGRVVGVVSDLDPSETGGVATPTVFVPYTHTPWGQARLLVRSADTSVDMLRSIEAAVRDVEPGIPLSGPFVSIRRMEEIRAAQRADERFNAGLVGAFAAVALLLAIVGMYGVVAYTVALRTRAIGIRLALGASPQHVVTGVVRRVAIMTGIGLLAGLLVAVGVSTFTASLLFGVSPVQPSAYAIVGGVLAGLALAAGYLPAQRAGGLDPASVLRAD